MTTFELEIIKSTWGQSLFNFLDIQSRVKVNCWRVNFLQIPLSFQLKIIKSIWGQGQLLTGQLSSNSLNISIWKLWNQFRVKVNCWRVNFLQIFLTFYLKNHEINPQSRSAVYGSTLNIFNFPQHFNLKLYNQPESRSANSAWHFNLKSWNQFRVKLNYWWVHRWRRFNSKS